MEMIGIGTQHCKLLVYIANRPPVLAYQERDCLSPAHEGELEFIVKETGNHWRKIFNIYAKLGFMLDSQSFPSWQAYRDQYLLQSHSEHALLFNASLIESRPATISLICGKAHALKLVDGDSLRWVDKDFALHTKSPLIVTPYFDYRQLSNIKLETLTKLIQQIS